MKGTKTDMMKDTMMDIEWVINNLGRQTKKRPL